MNNYFTRTEMILGKENLSKLKNSRVAVFGIGGVGGYTVEALVRSGVGTIDIIDNDDIDITNINRQILATSKTVGKSKVDVCEQRIKEINPDTVVNSFKMFFNAENSGVLDFSKYNYIVDAIDTVSSKIELILKAKESDVPVISSMGTGNKINPAQLEVSDIYKTSVCPLARVMRYELKKRNVKSLKVVYSKEQPKIPEKTNTVNGRHIPGSTAFVPACAGFILASEVVKDLIK